jgi:hypothetical protein
MINTVRDHRDPVWRRYFETYELFSLELRNGEYSRVSLAD